MNQPTNKIAILGSCVTRDAFGFMDGHELDFYLARSSLASIYAPPVGLDIPDDHLLVEGKGPFENRMLRLDLEKGAADLIRKADYQAILIDFIDERFDLLAGYGTLITRSNLLNLTQYGKDLAPYKLLRRKQEETVDLWRKAAASFLSDLGGRPVVLHRAYWAERYVNDETGDICTFSKRDLVLVHENNLLLKIYYDYIIDNYDNVHVVDAEPDLTYSNFAHRWGRDVFHFSDAYYQDIARKIGAILSRLPRPLQTGFPEKTADATADLVPPCLRDRDILWYDWFSLAGKGGAQPIVPESLNCGPGRVSLCGTHVIVEFDPSGGQPISQQARYPIRDDRPANGIGMRVRISGWDSINYIGIGHTVGATYHHVKATHPRQGEWFDFCVGFRDLAWGWRNAWNMPEAASVKDVRFYVKGVAGKSARIEISDIYLWAETEHPDVALGPDAPLSVQMTDALTTYQKLYFPQYDRQAGEFMKTGACPLAGTTMLDWPLDATLPPELGKNGTYQYSWHSLHPAVLLLLLAKEGEQIAPLFAARDMVVNWLDRHLDTPTDNMKYAWYDHGVAERTFAFLMLYELGLTYDFDIRFMTRLRRAIHSHARLLASEVFYAGHQPTRYHNHAWFQDIALLTVGLFFPKMPVSDHWITLALERIEDQFTKLIVRDGNFAVFAENSFGYHLGVERIVSNVGFFAGLSGRNTEIPAIAEAMSRFSTLIRYPDGKRTPAQGDSFRLPNAEQGDPTGRSPYDTPQVEILPHAGYAVIKGNHENHPFMLTVFASSHSRTHKHADNLSFTLYADGIEWLLDPSFHSHEYSQSVPAYLRGPWAHNAFVLAEEGAYSIDPGVALLSGEDMTLKFRIDGHHDAWDGARVHRTIEGALESLDMHFTDWIEPADKGLSKQGTMLLHCGEGVEVCVDEAKVFLTHPASTITIMVTMHDDCDIRLLRGQKKPVVRGVAGTLFLQSVDVFTIEVTPKEATKLKWSLAVQSRSSGGSD